MLIRRFRKCFNAPVVNNPATPHPPVSNPTPSTNTPTNNNGAKPSNAMNYLQSGLLAASAGIPMYFVLKNRDEKLKNEFNQ